MPGFLVKKNGAVLAHATSITDEPQLESFNISIDAVKGVSKKKTGTLTSTSAQFTAATNSSFPEFLN